MSDFSKIKIWQERAKENGVWPIFDGSTASKYMGQEIDDLRKLKSVVEQFIQDNQISCEETIFQCDWVIENAYDFIAKLCEVVGYLEEE